MTVKDLKRELKRFDDNLIVCLSDIGSCDFHEAELVIIEPHVQLYDDENNKITTQDILYIG